MNELRILIVDDHPVVGEGLCIFLKAYPDIEVVGTASDGLEGFEMLVRHDPDIVLLDMGMPKLDGVEAIQLYLRKKPNLGIVIFSGHKNDVNVYQALDAGARGYVVKGNPISQVVDAVREVHRGGYWLSSELTSGVINSFLRRPDQHPHELDAFKSLTSREQQVFRLFAKGMETREIADLLNISPKTVAKYRVAVKQKLNLKNVVEMANYATRIGLSEIDMQLSN
ncbi:MAG: response regulator transcription factor [Desulfuromonadales bacterium]|nr:response regulator transcription factor [Desulfuromonadales bacterium]